MAKPGFPEIFWARARQAVASVGRYFFNGEQVGPIEYNYNVPDGPAIHMRPRSRDRVA